MTTTEGPKSPTDCAPPDPESTRPRVPPPPGACDCHSHVFGPSDRFPFVEDRSFTPPDAPLEMIREMHDVLGLQRGVLVQSSAHGTDNRSMLYALEREPRRYRGVAVVNRYFTVQDLEHLASGGVRGARFNHLFQDGALAYRGGVGIEDYFALHDVMADLGWHLQLWTNCRDLPDLWPRLKNTKPPIIVDHMGRIDASRGLAYPGFDLLRGLLADGKIWVKLSGPYRATDNWPDYPEARPFHEALVAANPDQCVWGLDWPHPNLTARMPNDGRLLDLFTEWTPDPEIRRRILVDNPARFYGFDD